MTLWQYIWKLLYFQIEQNTNTVVRSRQIAIWCYRCEADSGWGSEGEINLWDRVEVPNQYAKELGEDVGEDGWWPFENRIKAEEDGGYYREDQRCLIEAQQCVIQNWLFDFPCVYL